MEELNKKMCIESEEVVNSHQTDFSSKFVKYGENGTLQLKTAKTL